MGTMQRYIYIKFESRGNTGLPEKIVERLAVFEDNDDPTFLAETLESWAAETGRTMGTVLSVSQQAARKMLNHHVSVAVSDKELAERERVKGLFNGRAKQTGS